MAKSGRQETPQEFRARMLSIGYMKRTNLTKEKIIVRDDGLVDDGKKAKVYKQEGDCSYAINTESDNRKDCDIHPDTHYQTLEIMSGL